MELSPALSSLSKARANKNKAFFAFANAAFFAFANAAFLPDTGQFIKEEKRFAFSGHSGCPDKASAKVDFFWSIYKHFMRKNVSPNL